jgi:anti-anti-sigma regulatory factor
VTGLALEARSLNGVYELCATGEINQVDATQIYSLGLTALRATDVHRLAINLSSLTNIDLFGLNAFIDLRAESVTLGKTLELREPQDQVREALRLGGLGGLCGLAQPDRPGPSVPRWLWAFIVLGVINGLLALGFGLAASSPKGIALAALGAVILAGDAFLFIFRRAWNG